MSRKDKEKDKERDKDKDKSPSRRHGDRKRHSSSDRESRKARKHKDHKHRREHRDRSSPRDKSTRNRDSSIDRSSRKKKSDKDRSHRRNRADSHERDSSSKRDRSLKRKHRDHSHESSSHRKKHRKRDRSHSGSKKRDRSHSESKRRDRSHSESKRRDRSHSESRKREKHSKHTSDSIDNHDPIDHYKPQDVPQPFSFSESVKSEPTLPKSEPVVVKTEESDANSNSDSASAAAARKKKRESKWSSGQAKVPLYLKPDDAEVYSIQIQINSLTTKLAQQNYAEEIEAMCRCPSPDPVYGHDGKRINTKEYRARERMEERKRGLILRLYALRPDLVPHADKMMGSRIEEKVFIPQEDYPDINFAGLIIGPRGMTQKELEKETGTKILLRGKGSAKPGKLNGGSAPLPGEDEPLHAYITSMSRESVDQAVEKIKKIIEDGIQFPELQNDLRKNQMKQLAILNGTYRETEGLNKLKILNEAQSIATNTIICSLCGGTGHLPRDCKVNNNEIPMMEYRPETVKLEGEYTNFITELGIDEATAKPAYLGFMPQQSTSSNPSQGASSFVRNFIFRS